jgi:methylenetetrahydrofolate reductase (NADPH)
MTDERHSNLHQKLAAGEFVLTAELSPPKAPELHRMLGKLAHYDGVDAINLLDMPAATLRMSSLGAAIAVRQAGYEPVLQMTCRDRNRLAMQGDLIAAYAHGIRNVLCLSGDFVTFGDHPSAKPVYDMDATNLIAMVNQHRAKGLAYSGVPLRDVDTEEPIHMQWCIGAAANPAGSDPRYLASAMGRKTTAGVDFFQTQPIFDLEVFDAWWKALEAKGVTEQVAILPGILPPRSARALEYMIEHVPGIWVPDAVIARMRDAKDPKREGIELALETMAHLRSKYAIAGFHLYPLRWTQLLPGLLEEAGFAGTRATKAGS